MKIKVTEYDICYCDISWQISNYINVMLRMFATPIADSDIWTFQMLYLNNLDQGDLVVLVHLKRRLSMKYINVCKSHITDFCASSHRLCYTSRLQGIHNLAKHGKIALGLRMKFQNEFTCLTCLSICYAECHWRRNRSTFWRNMAPILRDSSTLKTVFWQNFTQLTW